MIGAGSIGQAIARRVSAGKHVLRADLHQENAIAAASPEIAYRFERFEKSITQKREMV